MTTKVTQLRPYLEMNEWIEATDELLAMNESGLPDGEVNWLLAIAHLSHLTKTIRRDDAKQHWIAVLRAFLRMAKENILCAALCGKMTTHQRLLVEHLSAGVAIAQQMYPAMDWCSEIEANEFGREGN